jgi:hypothetical protein
MQLEDKKKKKPTGKKSGVSSSPGAKLIKAKAIVGSKASRGFSTKKPPKVHLSYPL